MKRKGYLWVVYSSDMGGYRIGGRIAISSEHELIIEGSVIFDSGGQFPRAVVMTETNDEPTIAFPVNIEPINNLNVNEIITDINNNSFTVIEVDNTENSSYMGFPHPQYVIEYQPIE